MAVLTVDDSCMENLMTVLSLQHVSQSNTDNDWCHTPMSVADTADNCEDNGASIQHNEAGNQLGTANMAACWAVPMGLGVNGDDCCHLRRQRCWFRA